MFRGASLNSFGAETLLGAIKTLKGQTMTVMNDMIAKNKEEAQDTAADALLEEPEDEVEEEDDEIQRIAGATSHKKKKRKTGF